MSDQERADRLAQAIDRMLDGEQGAGDDPLLGVAENLASAPLEPSAQARARFERQLEAWFGAPPAKPPFPRHIRLLLIGVGIAVLVIILIGLPSIHPVSVATPTEMALPTESPTTTPTRTATITPTPALTATVTPIPDSSAIFPLTLPTFARVIVNGRIDSIQDGRIVILGQSVRIIGDVSKLCVGDVVRIEVTLDPDGAFFASQSAVVVEKSACPATPAPRQNPGGAGGGSEGRPDDDHHHDED